MLVAAKGHRFEALYQLAVTSCVKWKVLGGLKWTDLDWVRQTLKIKRQLIQPHGRG